MLCENRKEFLAYALLRLCADVQMLAIYQGLELCPA